MRLMEHKLSRYIITYINVFLTVHHELTIYWLPTWCTNYYLFI